jgi:hypothetical protein
MAEALMQAEKGNHRRGDAGLILRLPNKTIEVLSGVLSDVQIARLRRKG